MYSVLFCWFRIIIIFVCSVSIGWSTKAGSFATDVIQKVSACNLNQVT